MAMTLGTVPFDGWELPEVMPFGGQQAMRVHRLIGGKRVIDALWPDDDPITWKGRLRGLLAPLKVRQLDTMRRAGNSHILSWDTFIYRVVIRRFSADYERFNEIPYSITCEVVEDLVAAEVGAFLDSLEDAVAGDLAEALGLSVDSPVITGALTAAQSAVNSVATSGTLSFSTLSGAAMAGLQSGFADSVGQTGSVAKAASSALDSVGLGNVLSGPATDMPAGIRSLVSAGETAWRATGATSLITRAAGNLARA